MIKPYFPPRPGEPPPLCGSVERRVRFEEVDALGIVWHGRYAGYAEEGRMAVCRNHGIGYLDLYRQGLLTPIKALHIDFHHPLRFDEEFRIEARLHYTEAARINFSCSIVNAEGRVCTTGYSVQLMLDAQGEQLLLPPPGYREFLARWQAQHAA